MRGSCALEKVVPGVNKVPQLNAATKAGCLDTSFFGGKTVHGKII